MTFLLCVAARSVESRILEIRGERVTLDRDLAAVYGETTKRINLRITRNPKKSPADLAFRLTKAETMEVIAYRNHLRNLNLLIEK